MFQLKIIDMINNGFTVDLIHYLQQNKPEVLFWNNDEEKKELEEMLQNRGELAAETFEKESRAGASVYEAKSAAYEELYSGFGTSQYLLIESILSEHFSIFLEELQTKGRTKDFIRMLMKENHYLFMQFEVDCDDFVMTKEYYTLCRKLKKSIHYSLWTLLN